MTFTDAFMKAASLNPIKGAKRFGSWYSKTSKSPLHKARKVLGGAIIGGTGAGALAYNYTKDPDMKAVPQGDYGVGNLGISQ